MEGRPTPALVPPLLGEGREHPSSPLPPTVTRPPPHPLHPHCPTLMTLGTGGAERSDVTPTHTADPWKYIVYPPLISLCVLCPPPLYPLLPQPSLQLICAFGFEYFILAQWQKVKQEPKSLLKSLVLEKNLSSEVIQKIVES